MFLKKYIFRFLISVLDFTVKHKIKKYFVSFQGVREIPCFYLQFDRIQVHQTEIFPVVFHLYISQFDPYIDFIRYKWYKTLVWLLIN